MTIGAPTALHRICEAIDNINSTAYSHSRAFVVEVMGRDCGWLALMAGIAYAFPLLRVLPRLILDFSAVAPTLSSSLNVLPIRCHGRTRCVQRSTVFVPGCLCCLPFASSHHQHREVGKRKTIVIVAEGAQDVELNPIRAEYVKEVLTERLGLDTRVTTLGHTQRGGRPCAMDRILVCAITRL